jgi:NTP pyrophosphatase (non-canonical NTP hydrolase)
LVGNKYEIPEGCVSLEYLYYQQKKFQEHINGGVPIPSDQINLYQYHMLALLEEVGELLKSDKRWKTLRNSHYNKEEKLDEIADVFITLLNVAMYSDVDANQLAVAIQTKIQKNMNREG